MKQVLVKIGNKIIYRLRLSIQRSLLTTEKPEGTHAKVVGRSEQ